MSDSDDENEVALAAVEVFVTIGTTPKQSFALDPEALVAREKATLLQSRNIRNPDDYRMVIQPIGKVMDDSQRIKFYIKDLASSAEVHIQPITGTKTE